MRTALVISFLPLLFVSSLARAESSFDAARCGYLPGEEISPPAGDVPANWPVFVVSLSSTTSVVAGRLLRVSDGTVVPTDVMSSGDGFGYAPIDPLIVGESYDLEHPSCVGSGAPHVTRYRAIALVAEPTTLGSIDVALYAANTRRGVENRVYFAVVTLDVDPSAEPWREALRWAVQLDDGIERTGRLPLAQTHWVALDCPGSSVITFRGVADWNPALSRYATDPTIASVDCAAITRVDWDTLRPLTDDEKAYWDTVPMDGAVPDLDAGTVDGGRMGMHTEADTDSGCAVAHGRSSVPVPSIVALAALVFLGARRLRARAASR